MTDGKLCTQKTANTHAHNGRLAANWPKPRVNAEARSKDAGAAASCEEWPVSQRQHACACGTASRRAQRSTGTGEPDARLRGAVRARSTVAPPRYPL